jgi:ribonuclease BN (tRNA processing enzyme)
MINTMTLRSFLCAAALTLGATTALPAGAAEAPAHPLQWTTLGTAGGPVLQADRFQPANLLTANGKFWLVDCGEGALQRLAALGMQPARISSVFISHLHEDHIGGLQALIGLRWMQSAPGVLTIYGPPGTETLVAGIVQSLEPSSHIGMAVRGARAGATPAQSVRVVTLRDGSDVSVDGVRVRAVRNSHFDEEPGHPANNGTESLSYRFDVPGYGVGYTGDTGPSEPLRAFFRGVDLLVSEVIDLPRIIENINGPHSPMPPQVRPALIEHLKTQHVTPQEAGAIAAAAGARRLVFTHLAIIGRTDRAAPGLVSGAHETFGGDVNVAHDLDKF